MSRTFESAWRKLERGDEHLKTLEGYIDAANEAASENPGTLKPDMKEQPGPLIWSRGTTWRRYKCTVIFMADFATTLDDSYNLVLGDAIHNYRQALDHLVWRLVNLHRSRNFDRSKVQWPDHRSAESFEDWQDTRTPGVPDKPQRAILKRYQPYRRGHNPYIVGWLNFLARRDKHREVTPTVVTNLGGTLRYDFTKGVEVQDQRDIPFEKLEPNTPIAEIDIAAPADMAKFDVKVHAEIQSATHVRRYSREEPVHALLEAFSALIRDLLDEFEALY